MTAVMERISNGTSQLGALVTSLQFDHADE